MKHDVPMEFEIQKTDYNKLFEGDCLYKYIDWSDKPRQNILTNLEVYYSPLDEFGNDENHIFETNFSAISDKNLRERALQLILEDRSFSNSNDVESLINQMIANYRKNIKEWIKSDRKERRDSLGILSLSINNNIPEMWTMFADDFKGLCVGFHSDRLFIEAKPTGGGLINYYSKTPELPPPLLNENADIASMLLEVHSLPLYYEQEAEYRLFRTHVPAVFM